MIRMIIANDHKIVRHSLKHFLTLATKLQVVGEATNGRELLDLVSTVESDLLLMDLALLASSPGGINLIQRIRQNKAAPRILVLSMHNDIQLVTRALKAGASGCLTKESDPETLVAAIRKVGKGGHYLDPSLVEQIVFEHGLRDSNPLHKKLSNREFQVLLLLVSGQSINRIAEDLSLSAKTVSTHKLRLMQKMQMRSIAELTRYAIEHQLSALH